MTALREAAIKALEFLEDGNFVYPTELADNLKAALAEPVLNPAPGYCKHCKQYTIEEPLPAEPVQEPVCAHGVGKTKCSFCSVEDKQPMQEPKPVAWMHVPYPGNAISPMLSLSKHREPSMYAASVPLYLKEQL